MFPGTITREEIHRLPPGKFEGEIILIDRDPIDRSIVSSLRDCSVLGFDTETRPSFRKGRKNRVALLQLASSEMAVVIRLSKIGLPEEIRQILSDPAIIKAGAAIRDDLRGLRQHYPFHPEGFVDLQQYVTRFGIESNGLRKMAGIVLGIKISKSQQLSNWEIGALSGAQLQYAATDAWICHEIYDQLARLENG